ncbi:MAG: tRNA lysidine(34) synthetase TilS [Gelidibacter sp.]
MFDQFQKHLHGQFPFLTKGKLLIAISGGLDSVVLTHLCKQANLDIALAHCNFNLRGDESNADEEFVLEMAENLNLEVFIESFETETFAKNNKLSTQVAARQLRYDWFYDLANQLDFDYILTAHHADDNLETFLINITRGTGLDGLVGIPEMNGKIVRPLLPFSREDLEVYAIGKKLEWREDSSNASKKYLRNKLRHDIIPTLKQMNPQLLQNFKTTVSNLQDAQHLVEDSLIRVQKKVVSVENDVIKLKVKKLKKLSNPKAYLYELLKDFNFTEWNDVVSLLDAQSGKQVFSPTHRLIKDRDFLLLTEIQTENEGHSFDIEESDRSLVTTIGTIFMEEVDEILKGQPNVVYLDKNKLKFPLTVRPWREGDYFYPFGMKGKKKISKYFKDEKMSLIEKENAYLLCSNDTIVWVIGKRGDERFMAKPETKQIIKFEIH